MNRNKYLKAALSIVIALIVIFFLGKILNSYQRRILNLCAVYVILGLSLNLINGFTGLFSLGHAGFMAVGAYTVGILTMPTATKELNFFMKPMAPFLLNLNMPFVFALLTGGLIAGILGFLIGAPVLKLTDDYLAIATLGFSEIIRVVFINTQSITNGALGIKGIPQKSNLFWAWGAAILTIIFMKLLIKGSYGKAFMAIREDEVAARSMGINLFKHKVMSFTIGSFLAGIGGGLLAASLGTIDPALFKFALTFNILLIVVLGGMGNINGSVVSAIIVTIAMEGLRFLDEPMNFGFFQTPALPGLRMVVFSLLLMTVIIFKKENALKSALERVRGIYAKD